MVLQNLIGKTVLVVEDDYMLACDLASTLATHGSEIVGPFPDLAKSLSAMDNTDVDAAVLDVHLGEDRVFALADRLWNNNIPFIIISGLPVEEIPDRFVGMRYLTKPVDTVEMAAALALSVGEYRSQISTDSYPSEARPSNSNEGEARNETTKIDEEELNEIELFRVARTSSG